MGSALIVGVKPLAYAFDKHPVPQVVVTFLFDAFPHSRLLFGLEFGGASLVEVPPLPVPSAGWAGGGGSQHRLAVFARHHDLSGALPDNQRLMLGGSEGDCAFRRRVVGVQKSVLVVIHSHHLLLFPTPDGDKINRHIRGVINLLV